MQRHLSCPQEWQDRRVVDLIGVVWAQGVLTNLLENESSLCPSNDCVHILENWKSQLKTIRDAWLPSLGALSFLTQHDGGLANVNCTFAQLCIDAMVSGVEGEFSTHLERPTNLTWDTVYLGKFESISASFDGSVASISGKVVGSSRVIENRITRTQLGWQTEGNTDLSSVFIRPTCCLLGKDLLDAEILNRDGINRWDVAAVIDERIVGQYDTAFSVLESLDVQYDEWVSNVTRRVVPCQFIKSNGGSGSWPDMPGVVYMSTFNDSYELAETLVHEASHQYFNLVTSIWPVDDGSDTALYYSPVVKRQRPLDRILIAYHAFANVELFYDRLILAGAQSNRIRQCRDKTSRLVDELELPLSSSVCLTECGRNLFGPLHARRLRR